MTQEKAWDCNIGEEIQGLEIFIVYLEEYLDDGTMLMTVPDAAFEKKIRKKYWVLNTCVLVN